MRTFDALYVISDLHLGGLPGRQIFRQAETLVAFIRHVATDRPDARVGLVLNGDVVDFLAEPEARYLDVDGAAAKLSEIMRRDGLATVFAALGELVTTPGRELVVVLGNHDVELALPDVQEPFVAALAGDDDAARGRITFATDGTGWRGVVRDGAGCSQSVYCFHGDIADPWNVVDHGRLRALVHDLRRGRRPEAWSPSGGTKLVIDLMNGVKESHPIVDVLKPETRAAIPVLVSFDVAVRKRLPTFLSSLERRLRDDVRQRFGFLSASGAEELDREDLSALVADWTGPVDEDAIYRAGVAHLGRDPRELLGDDPDDPLGVVGAISAWLRGEPRAEILREALESFLRSDESFQLDACDPPYRWAERQEIVADVVVAGHTHLPRRIARSKGGTYFNSGTWISLIKLRVEDVKEKDGTFRSLWERMQAARHLHELEGEDGILMTEPTVVEITPTLARLREVDPKTGAPGEHRLERQEAVGQP